MPKDNFLKPEWQHKPFRNYTILYDADLHRARFTRTPDGMRHGSFEFVAMVYTAEGEAVNSIIETAELNVSADRYRELLVSGLQMKEEIAIPGKGQLLFCASVCTTKRATRWAHWKSRRSDQTGRRCRERSGAVMRMIVSCKRNVLAPSLRDSGVNLWDPLSPR